MVSGKWATAEKKEKEGNMSIMVQHDEWSIKVFIYLRICQCLVCGPLLVLQYQ